MRHVTTINRNKKVFHIGIDEFLEGKWLMEVKKIIDQSNVKIVDVDYTKHHLSVQTVRVTDLSEKRGVTNGRTGRK